MTKTTSADGPMLPLPNPQDWTDTAGAAAIMGVARPTVYDYVDRRILSKYRVGRLTLFWVPECREVAGALVRLQRKAGR